MAAHQLLIRGHTGLGNKSTGVDQAAAFLISKHSVSAASWNCHLNAIFHAGLVQV